jgi:AmmeMemoRadiSam system protein A
MLSEEQKKKVLKLCREAIFSYFTNTEPKIEDKFLSEKQGVFVTLKLNEELRGCIGFPEPVYQLGKAIVFAAKAAAFEDPRFPQLKESELKKIKIEASVLTKPQLIKVKKPEEYIEKIEVGKDGLIVNDGFQSGLLLPKVAEEYEWDAKEFIEQTCVKAGLPTDAWKDKDTKVFKFQAQVFGE